MDFESEKAKKARKSAKLSKAIAKRDRKKNGELKPGKVNVPKAPRAKKPEKIETRPDIDYATMDTLFIRGFQDHLEGALSNYVVLGEIPEHNVPGTQGFRQHQALIHEIKTRGVVNEIPLYRGAARDPDKELADPGHVNFLSYSENRKIAKRQVDQDLDDGRPQSKVIVAEIGTVKGIRVNDYDYPLPDQAEEYGFSRHEYEEEWLVLFIE